MNYDELLRDHRATRRDVFASWIALGLFFVAMVAGSHLSGLCEHLSFLI